MNTYIDRKFLARYLQSLQVAPLGQKRPLPENEGKTVNFFQWNEIDLSVTNATLTEGANPSETTFTGNTLAATLKEYGGFSKISSLIKRTHVDKQIMSSAGGLWGEAIANVIDNVCQREIVANGAYALRADLSTTYMYDGAVAAATAATTLVCTALETNTNYGDSNDDLNQSIITITGGTGKGQTRPVTDYVASGGVCTISPAWDTTPDDTSTFHVASADTTLTTSNGLITTTVLNEVLMILETYNAPKINGFYIAVLSPRTIATLRLDTAWIAASEYKSDPRFGGLLTGEIGQWMGFRVLSTTKPFRFPQTTIGTSGASYGPGALGANYSATGAVYANLFFGAEAFGVTTLNGEGGGYKPTMIYKDSGPNDTSNALNRFSTVGGVLPFVCKALKGLWMVQVWTLK